MQDQLKAILESAEASIAKASTKEEIEKIRVDFLGKKGKLTGILKSMGGLSKEERPVIGKLANEVRENIENMIAEASTAVKEAGKAIKIKEETLDVTVPGIKRKLGAKHPISVTIDEITKIFMSMGFSVADGPEVETVFNNFDGLNAPQNHPSRDLTDTFYIADQENVLLRTQTSTVQIRTLLEQEPPIKIISPGRCFRCDTPDATHSPMFHQVEGLVVGEGITMADLKGTLDAFVKQLFGPETKTKLRPHHFPFTEPSAEVDVSCFKCGGKGCSVCKGSGWIEILGAGLVHPNVLKVGGIDTEKYSGFAFGMGVERVAMLKYEIDDIRLLYENDMRFIEQFK
ncbi:MAG: phenylalanine--tRNA ligase subunit alpha [Bacillota bacterium]|nr:phenylalanine--tRNA ligase subunit alpha [Bacillota bacterium]